MTTTTRSPGPEAQRSRHLGAASGFTLVEVMIGAALSTVILAAVLTSYLFIIRSGANLVNYSSMEAQARSALELFAEDTRQASAITWNSANSVTLVVNSAAVVYEYDTSSNTFFRRTAGDTRALLTGITAFQYKAYNINGAEITDFGSSTALTAAGKSTKQLQVSLSVARSTQTVVRATNVVLSARFILRNKRITT